MSGFGGCVEDIVEAVAGRNLILWSHPGRNDATVISSAESGKHVGLLQVIPRRRKRRRI